MPTLRRVHCTRPGETTSIGWGWPSGDLTAVRCTASTAGLDVVGVLPPLDRWGAFVKWAWSESPYGRRKWLTCPVCDRRVGVLYLVDGPELKCGDHIPERYCLADLSHAKRPLEHRRRARRRVGLEPDGAGGRPLRPSGMRVNEWLKRLDRWHESELAVIEHVAASHR
jgi:hypothetical protein